MSDKTELKNSKDTEKNKSNRVLNIIGIVLCVILVPVLIVNCTLIVKSWINKDEVPSIGGVMPLIVLTDSMAPEIKSGDIIITKEADVKSIKVGDDISFFDPAGNGSSIVTHRVIEIIEQDGQLFFRTRGINNNTDDRIAVPADKLVGKYSGVRIPLAGNIALFMQTAPGMIVCVVLPIILLVGYDILRRRKYEKSRETNVDELMAELEALKAAAAQNQAAQNQAAQNVATEATEQTITDTTDTTDTSEI